MENNLNINSGQSKQSNLGQAGSKKNLWVALVFLFILLIIFYSFYKYKNEKVGDSDEQNSKLSGVMTQIPQELVFQNAQDVKLFTVEKNPEFALRPNESMQENGITYTVDKMQKDVQSDVFREVNEKRWIFTKGTVNIEGGIIYKFTDGHKYYFVKLTGGMIKESDGNYKTIVSIIPVNK